jgi:hypothetical protein
METLKSVIKHYPGERSIPPNRRSFCFDLKKIHFVRNGLPLSWQTSAPQFSLISSALLWTCRLLEAMRLRHLSFSQKICSPFGLTRRWYDLILSFTHCHFFSFFIVSLHYSEFLSSCFFEIFFFHPKRSNFFTYLFLRVAIGLAALHY